VNSAGNATNFVLGLLKYKHPVISLDVTKTLPRTNRTAAMEIIRDMKDQTFIDLNTRALFVDMSFYNLNLQLLMTIRLTFEFFVGGGVFASKNVIVHDITTCSFNNSFKHFHCKWIWGWFYYVANTICGLVTFALLLLLIFGGYQQLYKLAMWHYGGVVRKRAKEVVEKLCTVLEEGRVTWGQKGNTNPAPILQPVCGRLPSLLWNIYLYLLRLGARWWMWIVYLLLQIALYLTRMLCAHVGFDLLSVSPDVDGDAYIDYRSASLWLRYSEVMNACFIMSAWLRLFEFFPVFVHSFTNFFLLFMVFLIGSSFSAHFLVGFYIDDYRNFQCAFIKIVRFLWGDWPTEILDYMNNPVLEYFFVTVFTGIIALIFVHLAIAIFFT